MQRKGSLLRRKGEAEAWKSREDHPRAKKFMQQPAGLWQGGSGLTEKTEGTWMGVLNLEKGDPDLRSPARDRQEWGKQWEALGICRHPKPPGTCPNITEWNKKNKKCLKKSF